MDDSGDDRRGRGEQRLSVALAVVLVALLATAGALGWQQRGSDPTPAVLSSARTAVTTFFDLDHATIDQDLDAMAALTTGDFAASYSEERAQLADQVTTKKLVITPEVVEQGTAVEYLHDDDAQVLVAVDARTAAANGAAETAHYRIRVVLIRTGDAWLVSGLEQVG